MNKHQRMVEEFMKSHGQITTKTPTLEDYPTDLRVSLLREEVDEFRLASSKGDQVEMIDALCDILYVTYGAASAMGVDLEPFFDIVHKSNVAKAWAKKTPLGKVTKPEGWEPPTKQIEKLLTELKDQS